MIGYVGSK